MRYIRIIKSNNNKLKYEFMIISKDVFEKDNEIFANSNDEERNSVLDIIRNDKYEVNNFKNFLNGLLKSKHINYLTNYTENELEKEFNTYKYQIMILALLLKMTEQ